MNDFSHHILSGLVGFLAAVGLMLATVPSPDETRARIAKIGWFHSGENVYRVLPAEVMEKRP
jgi:hypothetical protein